MLSKSFTLIELVMVIAIITILSVSGAWLMSGFIQNSVFMPNQINMDMLASDAIGIMVDGDNQAKGLRFSRQITNAQPYQVNFIDQDAKTVYYRLDTGSVPNKLYRSINAGAEASIPYYASGSGIAINGIGGKLFTYYDANESITTNATNVRRIEIGLITKTGTGSYTDWEGQSQQNSSVTVDKFQ